MYDFFSPNILDEAVPTEGWSGPPPLIGEKTAFQTNHSIALLGTAAQAVGGRLGLGFDPDYVRFLYLL
jgi:hypothetical protein